MRSRLSTADAKAEEGPNTNGHHFEVIGHLKLNGNHAEAAGGLKLNGNHAAAAGSLSLNGRSQESIAAAEAKNKERETGFQEKLVALELAAEQNQPLNDEFVGAIREALRIGAKNLFDLKPKLVEALAKEDSDFFGESLIEYSVKDGKIVVTNNRARAERVMVTANHRQEEVIVAGHESMTVGAIQVCLTRKDSGDPKGSVAGSSSRLYVTDRIATTQ